MQDNISTYRIHTGIGSDAPNVLNVKLQQTYDMLEVLSLKLNQTNTYNFYESSYGIVVGRVLANDAFGIPNAKVSIFIEVDDAESIVAKGIYPFTSIRDADANGVRYNLLPDEQISACYQNVGTFPNKRLVLDNNDIIEIFDKYWKYTTVTNEAGDYMLFGIPTGDQQLHVDVDLSDIGVLSQRPRDMIYKGYNAELFESPNKFRQSQNLDSLSQIFSQNKGVYVYPYWGDTSNTEETIAITRCDIQLEYKFEPTCIFMGSIITDTGANAIGKSCAATEGCGRMENMAAGEGSIEMIRKTLDGKVEEFQIKGNRLIDGDGIWCYQIPMNLDYVRTDEYGNIVPTDDPNRGIPTRTRVRFRISLDETPNDAEARKRCRFLVPNNPRNNEQDFPMFYKTKEVDYEFGSLTREESYKDLFWNKVYTVKSYIPRLQKNSKETNRKHTGVKAINYYGDNNPFPYTNVSIKLSFTYRLICVITKVIIYIIGFINTIFSIIGLIPCWLSELCIGIWKFKVCPFGFLKKAIPKCIKLSSEFCDDGVNKYTYYPGCTGCVCDLSTEDHVKDQMSLPPEDQTAAKCEGLGSLAESTLMTCIETSLAQDNDCVNFNFENDWVNGTLYAPLWYRKITPKKSFLFGLFSRKAKDEWCSADRQFGNLNIWQFCALNRERMNDAKYASFNSTTANITPMKVGSNPGCGDDCHKSKQSQNVDYGVVLTRENMYGQTVYYYKALQYLPSLNNNQGDVVLLFATDIVLLGSLNDCDMNGIPQFFKNLEGTTYKIPEAILFTDNEVTNEMGPNGEYISDYTSHTEMTGRDWGNINKLDECDRPDGGLFYGIGCSTIEVMPKSCINLMRICEFGVALDETKYIEDLTKLESGDNNDYSENLLIPDGFISYDELYNLDERSMFATLNSNNLRTKLNNKNGLYEYDLRYLYPESFDGSLYESMRQRQSSGCDKTYRYNYNLESFSRDYYIFRMGDVPFYYDNNGRLPRYENSFYFYFGLKSGKTAIEKFNSQFFSNCENTRGEELMIDNEVMANSWCTDKEEDWDGYIKLDLTGISTPYTLELYSPYDTSLNYQINDISSEKICIYNSMYVDERENDENFIGYERIDDHTIELKNTTYNITITDAEGNVTENTISMNGKYLSFSTYVEDFNEPNNVLSNEIGDDCTIAAYRMTDVNLNTQSDESGNTDILDKTAPFQEPTPDNPNIPYREIGGIIGVYDLYYNNEPMYKKYAFRIDIKPVDETFDDYENHISFDENGSIIPDDNSEYDDEVYRTCRNWQNSIKYNGMTYNGGNQYFAFGVPRGDIDYRVTVTQLCNEGGIFTDSNNTIYQDVTVNEPIPFKMFIGSVIDYDVIKDKFSDTGWTINGDTSNYSVTYNGNISDAWLHISDESNYNWDANEKYTLVFYEENGFDGYNSAEEALQAAKDAFISAMKETFYINCPTDKKSITIQAQTDDYPVSTKIVYKEEMTSENDDNMNVISSCGSNITDDSTINDIGIPTITNIDNTDFASDRIIEGDICYAKDVTANQRIGCSGDGEYKHPYFVAIINGKGKTKPSNVAPDGVGENGNNEWRLEGSVVNYFGFHIIDKSFRFNMMSWSYINDIPYYKPDEVDKVGQSINMNGFITGIIYNGASTSTDEYAEFVKQLYNNKNIIIETYTLNGDGTPNEDAIPTKRVVIGEHLDPPEYPNYDGVSEEANDTTQYISVPNIQTKLTLEDDNGCQIEETIYGNMRIILNNTSINDCKNNNNSVLKVSVSNGDGNELIYIVNHNQHPFILNKIYENAGNYQFNAGTYTDYDYMRYEVSKELIENIKYTNCHSQIPSEEDPNSLINSDGYRTTGSFTPVPNNPVYIIAITENNCRCISPVYDFTRVDVQIILMKYTVNTAGTGEGTGSGTSTSEITTPPTEEGGEETTETVTGDVEVDVTVDTSTPVTTYRFGIKINNMDNLYYFKNYDFSAEVTCTASEGNNITFNVTSQKGDDSIAYTEISKNIYDALVSMANNPLLSHILVERTQVIATDYTGLRHNCFIINNIDIQEVVE